MAAPRPARRPRRPTRRPSPPESGKPQRAQRTRADHPVCPRSMSGAVASGRAARPTGGTLMTEPTPAPEPTPIDPAVEAALVPSREARAAALLEFARIPSISTQPEHAADMMAAAEWAAARLRAVGATDVEVFRTDLHPIGYGRIHQAQGAPTVLVYCHFDVQPVDPVELWETAPFEPFLRDGRFVGRGVA